MDEHYPTNGSSSLSYQWIKIILPTGLHLYQHHTTDGSSLSLSYQWMSIILPMDHHHYPTNESSLSYRRIVIIILPMDLYYHHPTNGSSSVLSYPWIIVNHHFIDEALSSYR
ncbi:hypothetical protein KY284_026472 [Solanum tuberosum]|nr:hypothetical protein KY284_026472 [Solanum tuberosum]